MAAFLLLVNPVVGVAGMIFQGKLEPLLQLNNLVILGWFSLVGVLAWKFPGVACALALASGIYWARSPLSLILFIAGITAFFGCNFWYKNWN